MFRNGLIFSSILLAIGCSKSKAPDAPSPPTEPAAGDAAFELPFERYKLDNGLTVILHKDPSDPIVAIATVVHVGSAREKPGRTGFAHFFEHMSFNNSENVPMGANRKMIPELGGTRNGGTWDDGTIYYEVVPKDAFEKLMWIDSDRFGYMINTVKEATLEREKQVVKNEKRQRVDNRAYGHTGTVIRKALYPKDHPYNWTVIGDLEDLQAATLDDVREFYFRYYVPANATLVIAGDIDFDETKAMVEKWFGEIKPGKLEPDLSARPVSLKETVKLFHLDNFAEVAELRMTFPTVPENHPDRFALEALGSILADGKSAPLFRTVVMQDKLASSLAAYQSSSELAGTFTVVVRANPKVDLDQVKASIDKAFGDFERDGFRDTDLARIKATSETAFYSGLESILSRALELGIYEEFRGGAEKLLEQPKKVGAVTREDVLRVYQTYVKGKASIVTSFVPKSSPDLTVAGSSKAPITEEKIVAGAEKEFKETDPTDFVRTPTKVDRSEPPLGPRPTPNAPDVWRASTASGIPVLGIKQDELPMVAFHLRIDGGQALDPQGKLGIASLAAELLNEGTKNKTPQELEDAIDLLGASLSVSASRTSIDISGRSLAKNFDAVMALVSEMLLEPRWDAAEFERLKTSRLADIAERAGNPPGIARLVSMRLLYGDTHVAGQPFAGTEASVKAITLADIVAWYPKSVSPKQATLHVAGAVDQPQVLAAMETLDQRWKGPAVTMPMQPTPAVRKNAPPYFIDVPDAKQSVIVVVGPGLRGDDPRYYLLTVATNRLGSGSSARLTQKLRIEKGYSYGAFSTFTRPPYDGAFVAQSQVRTNVTLESLEIFKDLIGNYKPTFTDGDLKTTVNLISKADTRRFETLRQLVNVLRDMSRFNLPDDYIARESKQLAGLTLADAHALIDENLREDQLMYLIVGDAKTQLANVAKFGRGKPVLLDRLGAPLKK